MRKGNIKNGSFFFFLSLHQTEEKQNQTRGKK